ncbi:autotransporter outer membrane beta-barrel domain-containing protein [Amylibacter sp.]|nr:autotransporter outer membrane beta-barrel domain-containing protein [Amylibacter sp.]
MTREAYGHGILDYGSNNTTTVSGSITTDGTVAYGIYNEGSNNTTTISGTVKATGASSVALYNTEGDGNSFTISGTVKATGAKSAALYNYSGSGNSFTLDEGATIIGDILARDNVATINSELIFNLGASTSYAYSVSGKGEGTGGGQWIFSDLDRSSQVVTTSGTGCDTTITAAGNTVCNLATAVGAANAEVQNELQYITSTSLINSLRLDTPVNTSQEETTATDVWFDAYGVSTERDASTWDTTGVVFNADTRGLTIGKPLVLGESFGLDLVFNTSQTDLDVGATKHQNIAAQSFNFGVVMTDLASSSNWDVDAFGFIGRNSYEGKRKVMNNQVSTGSETVTSSYSGTKALVGFDVDYTTPINETVSFKGGINANLSNEKIGAYSESKYSTWNARTVSQAASGISAGLTHKRDLLSTFVTLGAEYSSLLSGEKASYTNNGTATSYTDHDASDDMISSVAVGFKYAGANGVSFEGAIKGSSSNKGLTSTSANFGLNWAF